MSAQIRADGGAPPNKEIRRTKTIFGRSRRQKFCQGDPPKNFFFGRSPCRSLGFLPKNNFRRQISPPKIRQMRSAAWRLPTRRSAEKNVLGQISAAKVLPRRSAEKKIVGQISAVQRAYPPARSAEIWPRPSPIRNLDREIRLIKCFFSAFHDPCRTGVFAEIRPNSNPIQNLDKDIRSFSFVFSKSPCFIAPTRQGDPPKFGCAPAQIQIWTRRSADFLICSSDLGVHSSAPNREILRNVAPPQPRHKFGQGEPPNKTTRQGDPLLKQLPTHRIVVPLQPPISRMLRCSSRMFTALVVVRLCVVASFCV